MALEAEEEFYRSIKADLLSTAPGQYVLIKGTELVDVFPTYAEAVAAAAAKFGDQPVLIKQILEQEPIETI